MTENRKLTINQTVGPFFGILSIAPLAVASNKKIQNT